MSSFRRLVPVLVPTLTAVLVWSAPPAVGADGASDPPPAVVPSPVPGPPSAAAPPPIEQQVLALTNRARARVGCPALRLSTALTKAATHHSSDMASGDFLDHTGSDGRGPIQRILEAGYPNGRVGENVAAGARTAAEAVQIWLDDPSHRANVLDCAYTDLGVGHAVNRSTVWKDFWAQEFGGPA
jgi:uncharacterized protein YkwD